MCIRDRAVAQELTRIGGLPIDSSSFKTEKLDKHLQVNLQVVDNQGEIVAQGRSISEIRGQLGAEHTTSIVEVDDATWNQDGLRSWDWGELPREIMIQRGGTQLAAFPAIVDQEDSVGLRLTDSANASDATTRQGLVRLFQITNRKSLRSQVNWLPDLDRHAVALSRLIPSAELKKQLSDLITRIAFVDRKKIPRTEADFQSLQKNAVEQISIATQEVAKWLPKFSTAVHEAYLQIEGVPQKFGSAKGDIRAQISGLKTEGFMAKTPWMWLQQYPRFFQVIGYRIEKLSSTPVEKDRAMTDSLNGYWEKYSELKEFELAQAIVDPELETFRWMIEELRVSLFAQKLGTSVTVSDRRMEKQWSKVRRV